MASLQSTTTDSLSVNNSAVWTTANSGSTGGIEADQLAGYNIEHFHATQRLKSLDLRTDAAYVDGTYYPMIIAGTSSDKWVTELDIRRTSVHQDGGSFGAFFGTFRYRGNGWNFWEVKENWGSGSKYPFVANFSVSSTDTKAAIWLRGDLTYFYRFNNNDSLVDTGSGSKSFSGGTISTTTTVSLPSSSAFLQHSLSSQGYNLGASSNGRWSTVFTVNSINVSSDARFKEEVEPLSFGLSFVKLLQPKSYTLKPQPHHSEEIIENLDTRRYHGLVAQEVKTAMDQEGIDINDFAGLNTQDHKLWSLRYDQFVPILVKAIQEQYDILDSVEERIKRLESA